MNAETQGGHVRRAKATGVAIARDVLQSITEERPLEQTFGLIAEHVADLAGFDFCGILLPTQDRRIHLAGAYNFPDHYEDLVETMFQVPYEDDRISRTPTSTALREMRTLVVSDTEETEGYAPWREMARNYGFRSMVSVPLIGDGETVGVLNGYSSEPRELTKEELLAVETLAQQAALALRITLLVDQQQTTISELQGSNEELERQREILERAHEIHLHLTNAVVTGADAASIAETLARLIGRPAAVVDAAGSLLCASELHSDVEGDQLFEPALRQLASNGGFDPDPPAARQGDDAMPEMIFAPIHIGSEQLGYVLAPEGRPASRDLDLRALEHAATVLSVDAAKERVERETEERLHSDFLFDLLNGRDTDARLSERATHFGFALGQGQRVLVATIDEEPEGSSSNGRAAEGEGPFPHKAVHLARDTLRERLSGALLSQLGNVITAVVPRVGDGDPLDAARAALLECRRRIGLSAPGIGLSAGIGSPADHPADFAIAYAEAQQCLAVLRRLDRRNQTVAIDELGLLGLFIDTNRPDRLVSLGQEVLGPAIEHDRRTDGALVETFDTYIDCDCDTRRCAEALFVHPNTVKYRLRRLEELCELNLRDPGEMLKATLARLSLRLLAAD